MSVLYKYLVLVFLLMFISGCNSVDRFSILKQCTVLGDESIVYARAHYVKLFYHYNPEKFAEPYQQIFDFDAETLKNTIDTYTRAVNKIEEKEENINDDATKSLLSTCKDLSSFVNNFVENDYLKALNHKSDSDPSTDAFFMEINNLVKFDHNIGDYNKGEMSFKTKVDNYKNAVNKYIKMYRKSIPTAFLSQRKP